MQETENCWFKSNKLKLNENTTKHFFFTYKINHEELENEKTKWWLITLCFCRIVITVFNCGAIQVKVCGYLVFNVDCKCSQSLISSADRMSSIYQGKNIYIVILSMLNTTLICIYLAASSLHQYKKFRSVKNLIFAIGAQYLINNAFYSIK